MVRNFRFSLDVFCQMLLRNQNGRKSVTRTQMREPTCLHLATRSGLTLFMHNKFINTQLRQMKASLSTGPCLASSDIENVCKSHQTVRTPNTQGKAEWKRDPSSFRIQPHFVVRRAIKRQVEATLTSMALPSVCQLFPYPAYNFSIPGKSGLDCFVRLRH